MTEHTHSRLYQILKLCSVDIIEGKRRRGQQRIGWVNSITHSMDMNLSKLWETVKAEESGILQSMGSQRVTHKLETENQQWANVKEEEIGQKTTQKKTLN